MRPSRCAQSATTTIPEMRLQNFCGIVRLFGYYQQYNARAEAVSATNGKQRVLSLKATSLRWVNRGTGEGRRVSGVVGRRWRSGRETW